MPDEEGESYMKLTRVLLLVAAGFSGAGLCAPGDEYAAQRALFAGALQAVEARQAPSATTLHALRDYPLLPYLSALQLRQSLEAPLADNDAAVAEFLKLHGDQPLTRNLRREWWQNLAQREQWPRYLAEVPAGTGDVNQQCQRFTALLKTGSGPELVEDVLRVWLTGESKPQSCVFPFDWLKQQEQLTEERRLRRARLAIEAGNFDLAELMIATLPTPQADLLRREVQLLRDPARELPLLVKTPEPAIPVDSLLAAWTKLIRGRPEDIESQLPTLLQAQQIESDRAGEFIRQYALGLSWNRDPRALKYFLAVPEGTQNEASQEWRIRAALWNGEWPLALSFLQRLPPALATQPRWRYWLARALEQDGQQAEAELIYLSLLDGNNYYAALAAVRMQAPLLPRHQPAPPPDAELLKKLLANPALLRSRELYLINRPDWARSEWNFALDGADRLTLMQASRLAFEWGWPGQGIGTAARAAVFDDYSLFYPRPYEAQVRAAAEFAGIPTSWIYSVMRQESLYDPRAQSKRDAFGLLQLLLPTARQTAQRWKRPLPSSREELFQPEINLPLGAAHLRDVSDRFDGRFILALGAYNAGATALARWLPAQPMDADIWIENIPFNETRGYIQKILWNIAVFGWLESGRTQDLSPLLQPVGAPAPAPATP